MLRVLVADDSVFMRKLLIQLIDEEPSMKVIGTAKNGLEAVDLVKGLKPDVVTMDVEMPRMNGLQALEKIMTECPVPVVMVSSLTHEGAKETIQALRLGAVDFIAKPSGSLSADMHLVKDDLIAKIKAASVSSLKKLTPLRGSRVSGFAGAERAPALKSESRKSFDQIFAIGTSTGGPRALESVLTGLPGDFPYPVLVVQHMPPKFTLSLAQRLNGLVSLNVVEAEQHQLIAGETVYIAPGGFHMEVSQERGVYRISLNEEPPRGRHRPSVDVLFESVARLSRLRRHLVIMTGMGGDGAKGMLEAKQLGASSTIAESEETSLIFGMPRVAIELGCVDHVVPLHKIADKMVSVASLPG
ncbi:protein-glutamate methylesterase/protein-glutamine glutaminase [Cohnella luojiensis]|uniref:Protein-glutamate methylesterase/protein-glutamine glutaminase n=1 Tax=Cohnella luojiensis TaxID=652876 RepID=A0A4Y8LUY1_9BACL|nr:chemotaxis response regulator protein-glutamate methylesterase [Cohnella luojiensis]TFE25416.1 chemotaxis response regulator protein-glutamate methylesterase [Cohnella luojiensis]